MSRRTHFFLVSIFVTGLAVRSLGQIAPRVSTNLQPSATFKELLGREDLGHLSPSDMAKIEKLLAGMTRLCQERADEYEGLADYLRNEGFKHVQVSTARLDRKDVLIVTDILTEYTTDIPWTLSMRTLRTGRYFAKSSISGIAKLIADGRVHDFAFSTWHILR